MKFSNVKGQMKIIPCFKGKIYTLLLIIFLLNSITTMVMRNLKSKIKRYYLNYKSFQLESHYQISMHVLFLLPLTI